MRALLFPSLLLCSLALPFAITACSDDAEDQDSAESNIVAPGTLGSKGDLCDATRACGAGLTCKAPSSGPPPGAVGLPLPTDTSRPKGLPEQRTCQFAEPGEDGSFCFDDTECNPGFACKLNVSGSSSTGGPPPGAVGLPLPPGTCRADASSSSSGGPPPGAVGLPIQPKD
jgi:hypothetical protein